MKLLRLPRLALVSLVFLAGLVPLSRAQQCVHPPDAELVAADGAIDDTLGRSVAIDGDTLVTGANGAGLGGAAYVFVRSGGVWTQQAKLVPSAPQVDEGFGFTVGISGDTIVVGAPFHDTAAGSAAGAAFVFERNGTTWTQKTMLTANDGGTNHHYGGAVTIDGTRLAVGASLGNHPSSPGGGAVYAYSLVSAPPFGLLWLLDQKVVPNDVANSFGIDVELKGNFLVVGATHSNTTAGADSGAVYVFERGTTWTQDAKLLGGIGAGDNLGQVLAFNGTRIAALAFGDDTGAPNGGAVHVFYRLPIIPSGHIWLYDEKVVNPDAATSSGLLSSIAWCGSLLEYSTTTTGLSQAWTYENQGTYVAKGRIRTSPSVVGDYFGISMASSGSDLVIGASGRSIAGHLNQGAAYFVDMSYPGFCTPQTYCTAKVTSNGCTPAIAAVGLPSASSTSNFIVKATSLRNNRPGLLLYKVNGARAASPFQGGTLCVGPSGIRRTPGVNSGGSPSPANDCSGVFSIDMNSFAHGLLGGTPDAGLVVAANVVQAQWWGRDPGFPAPDNTMLSDAIEWIVAP